MKEANNWGGQCPSVEQLPSGGGEERGNLTLHCAGWGTRLASLEVAQIADANQIEVSMALPTNDSQVNSKSLATLPDLRLPK